MENSDTNGIRERCIKAGQDVSLVEPIDFVFDEKKSLRELTNSSNGYDYVVSAHVTEHIPNLVQHFKEIHEVLAPGGIYAMLIPDKNYCGDILKPASTFGEVVEAYLNKASKPRLSVYLNECRYSARPSDISTAGWDNRAGGVLRRKRDNSDSRIEEAISSGSIKKGWLGHSWFFTPFSFASIFLDLIQYNLLDFDLLDIIPTHSVDFIAVICTKPTARQTLNRQSAYERLYKLKYLENLPDFSVSDDLLLNPVNPIALTFP